MNITIRKIQKTTDVTTISCPFCAERLRGVVFLPGCEAKDVGFRCKKCHEYWKIDITQK